MVPRSPRISPRVLADLARRVHPDAPTLPYQDVIVMGSMLLWVSFIFSAPCIFILLFFGLNYTVIWLRIAGYLLLFSFFIIGSWFLYAALLHPQTAQTPRFRFFFIGSSIIIAVVSFAILLRYGGSTTIDSRIPILAAGSLIPVLIGLGWLQNKTTPASKFIQVLRILTMAALGIGMLIGTIMLQAEQLNMSAPTVVFLRGVGNFCNMFIPVSILLSLIANRSK